MELGTKVYFKKSRTVPKNRVSSDIPFEYDDEGLAVTKGEEFLVVKIKKEGEIVIGAFAKDAKDYKDYGKLYYMMQVPKSWLK